MHGRDASARVIILQYSVTSGGRRKGAEPGGMIQELDLTWSRVMSVWWLIFWRGSIGALLVGGVIGFIIGFIFGVLRIPGIPGGIGGLLWFVLVVRMALGKKYQGFRIALLPRS